MITYEDQRQLTICHVRDNGIVLLPFEAYIAIDRGDVSTERRILPGWDAELEVFRRYGIRGAHRCSELSNVQRNEMRDSIRQAITNHEKSQNNDNHAGEEGQVHGCDGQTRADRGV